MAVDQNWALAGRLKRYKDSIRFEAFLMSEQGIFLVRRFTPFSLALDTFFWAVAVPNTENQITKHLDLATRTVTQKAPVLTGVHRCSVL